jgi:hypothetical protein
MNSPEWFTIMIGCISCLVSGLIQPSCAILLTKTVNVSHPLSFFGGKFYVYLFAQALYQCTSAERHKPIFMYGCLFLLLGALTLVIHFCQVRMPLVDHRVSFLFVVHCICSCRFKTNTSYSCESVCMSSSSGGSLFRSAGK